MESSLRYEDVGPWFEKSVFRQPADYDSLIYDRIDDSFYTVIPDLSPGLTEDEIQVHGKIEKVAERLEKERPPHLLSSAEVDAVLAGMFNFDAFQYLDIAEDEAVDLSEDRDYDFVPARVQSGNPSALMYSGPTSYLFMEEDGL